MSTAFEIPEWLLPPPTPPTPVDDHRVEALVNRFIAGKQEALFTAPDAYYRLQGADALDGRPAIDGRLQALRAATLDLARDDGERSALEPRLDLHIDDAADGIDRHVAEQQQVYQRQVVSRRQELIQRAAELEHDNDDKIMGLAEANATAAGEGARMDGAAPNSPEEAAAVLGGRSNILRTAINERIANGKGAQALALFDRIKDQLAPADRQSLDTPVQAARHDQLADQWITRESNTNGPPLQQRVETDSDLPSDAKFIVRAKIDARDSADEAARAAKVQALDDQAEEAFRILPINPGAYRPGTFARLADAYEVAGAPERAQSASRVAKQEAFLQPFAQASVEKQQGMLDGLPEGELRERAIVIQYHQAQAFVEDAFAAGTTLYKDVGAPAPIDDVEGRIRQARQISKLRGGIAVMPFTRDEIDDMRRTLATGSEADKEAVRARLSAVPANMRPSIEPQGSGSDGTMSTFRVQAAPAVSARLGQGVDEVSAASPEGGRAGLPTVEPPPGTLEYQTAEAQPRALNKPSYDDLSSWEKVKVEAKRFLAEGEGRGATFRLESALQRWERTQELLNEPNIQNDVVGKRYLLRNRNVAAELAAAAGQLVVAQRKLKELPSSDALRQLFEVRSAAEAATLLDEKGGKIASAAGLGSLPALTVGIAATAILGPIGGGLVLTGNAGLEGYAKGLIGALARRGVDVANPDRLVTALLNKELMEEVRKDARTDGAIEAGISILAAATGGVRFGGKVPKVTKAERVSAKSAEATASEGESGGALRFGKEPGEAPAAEQASAKSAKGAAPEGEEAGGVRLGEEPARLTNAKRIVENARKGREWEKEFADHFLKNESKYYFAQQVQIKPPNGPPVLMDFLVMDRETGQIFLLDPKDIKQLRLRQPNHRQSYPEIAEKGATIMSKGKPGPGAEGKFPVGKVLPPTRVQIQTRSGAYYASRPAGSNRVSLKRWDEQPGRFDDLPTQP